MELKRKDEQLGKLSEISNKQRIAIDSVIREKDRLEKLNESLKQQLAQKPPTTPKAKKIVIPTEILDDTQVKDLEKLLAERTDDLEDAQA